MFTVSPLKVVPIVLNMALIELTVIKRGCSVPNMNNIQPGNLNLRTALYKDRRMTLKATSCSTKQKFNKLLRKEKNI